MLFKRRLILYFLTFSCLFCVHAQKEFSRWYFGNKAGIDFTSNTPQFTLDGVSLNANIPTSISDSQGNLLFYSNNRTVWDKTHNVMQNGEDLIGGISAYNSVIIPKPNNSDIYYLFTIFFDLEEENITTIYYSEIDMSLNNGLGAVTEVKNVLFSTNLGAKLTVVQHANNIDFWLLAHEVDSANFHSYLISENGISSNPVISTNGSFHPGTVPNFGGHLGCIKLTHDAKRLAIAYQESSPNALFSFVELMSFNDLTGEVYGDVLKIGEFSYFNAPNNDATGAAYFIEFSPNNKYMYVSCNNLFGDPNTNIPFPSSLFQYDIETDNIEDLLFSEREIHKSLDRLHGIELGLDDRIYVVSESYDNEEDRTLGVIQNPNEPGSASGYEHLSFILTENPETDPRGGTVGLPQNIRQFFYLNLDPLDLCGGQAFNFGLNSSDEILNVNWNFGDGTTSTELSPNHSFEPGTYTVTAIVEYEYSIITRSITIDIPEDIPVPNNFTVCDDSSNDGIETFDLGAIRSEIFRDDSCGSISFHINEEEASSNTNPLADLFTNSSNPQTIYIRIDNAIDPLDIQISPIEINIEEFPTLEISNYSICDELNDSSEFFDLDNVLEFIVGSTECVELSFYFNSSDANIGINSISDSIEINSTSQTIYIRIDDLRLNTFTIYPFNIELIPKPQLELNDTYYICPNEILTIGLEDIYDNYEWSTGSTSNTIEITEIGSYSLTVSNDSTTGNCSFSQSFTVEESIPPTTIDFEINDLSNNNSIIVIDDNLGNYEYSIDGINYQESNVFSNLQQSEYTVFIRDVNRCGVISETAYLLVYPKYFTPNNDTVNDFWQVKSSFTEPEMTIEIYDRYGKLLYTMSGNDIGWDGSVNSQPLPSNDYWFRIIRPSNGRTYRGHFTLKR